MRFDYTGNVQTFTVLSSGVYDILDFMASGLALRATATAAPNPSSGGGGGGYSSKGANAWGGAKFDGAIVAGGPSEYPPGGHGGAGASGKGGGGGGYTGGSHISSRVNNGGGTSFLSASFTNVTDLSGVNTSNGYVTISQVSVVPELSTWAMMLAGFAGLGVLGYRRNKAAFGVR